MTNPLAPEATTTAPTSPTTISASAVAPADAPLLEVRHLVKHFRAGRSAFGGSARVVHALDDVSFTVSAHETLGLVGESGSGKSTLGRTVLRLSPPTSGQVLFRGQDLATLSRGELRATRQHMQIVFQDPVGSLNPRLTVEQIVGEPLAIHGLAPTRAARRARVAELLSQVGLPEDALARQPHAFSGGQRQRIGIARALASRPDLVVADEPVSALDVSIQAQIVNLLADLQAAHGLAFLFVSHDLKVVRHLAHRIAVLLVGHLVELGPAVGVAEQPAHPYTHALLSAVPAIDPSKRRARILLTGEPPSPLAPPSGCRFHPRCPLYQREGDRRCSEEVPQLRQAPGRTAGHQVACHFPLEPLPLPPGP
jgi:oligopeptide/dipeptide ABC transporter ATP-binding protein